MGKIQSKTQRSKRTKRRRFNFLRFNLFIVPILLLIFLGIYTFFQYLGERLGYSPVLVLFPSSWMTSGEAVIMFIIFLAISLWVALNIGGYLLHRATTNNTGGYR